MSAKYINPETGWYPLIIEKGRKIGRTHNPATGKIKGKDTMKDAHLVSVFFLGILFFYIDIVQKARKRSRTEK